MNPIKKKILKAAAIMAGFLVAMAALRVWYLDEQGNFHSITPGEAYRSAQLDQDELVHYIGKYQIRSVINLRGENDAERWYTVETAMCRNLGVRHYDLGLTAYAMPTALEIRELLRLFSIAPRPVLIHCKAGADRSGLAAAIWKMTIDGSPKSVAMKQLSLRFGHMPFGSTHVMDTFIEKW